MRPWARDPGIMRSAVRGLERHADTQGMQLHHPAPVQRALSDDFSEALSGLGAAAADWWSTVTGTGGGGEGGTGSTEEADAPPEPVTVVDEKALVRTPPKKLASTGAVIPVDTVIRVTATAEKGGKSYYEVEEPPLPGHEGPARYWGWTSAANTSSPEGAAEAGSAPAGGKAVPKKTAIAKFIEDQRESYGLSAANEERSAKFYSKGKKKALRAMSPADIEKYLKKYAANADHIERSKELFRKTSLTDYTSGEDIAFIVAISTREGGSSVFRTDENLVVSGGKDTHKKGVSGLDNLGNKGYRKEYEAAGLDIKEVDTSDPDLKKKKRNPAWVQAKDLLFGHMLTTAGHEKGFRTRSIGRDARAVGLADVDAESLWANLTVEARRTWLGLHYSGVGFVQDTLRELLRAQTKAGTPLDLNAIMSHDEFKHLNRVVLARATALRAALFAQLD